MKITLTYKEQTTVAELTKAEIIVGRPSDAGRPDLDLSADATVSRRHARLYLRDGEWWVEDAGSKYGTFVNGVKLEYRRMLKRTDTVRIGETTLRFQADEEETPTVQTGKEDEVPTIKTIKSGPAPG